MDHDSIPSENLAVDKKLLNRVTRLNNIPNILEKRLDGYVKSSQGTDLVRVDNSLCGSNIIRIAVAMISPFCEESNLIGDKQEERAASFRFQINQTAHKFNNALLQYADEVDIKKRNTILMVFLNTLVNVHDIILNAKGDISKIFSHYKVDEDDNNIDNF